jgi:hypothetical protein
LWARVGRRGRYSLAAAALAAAAVAAVLLAQGGSDGGDGGSEVGIPRKVLPGGGSKGPRRDRSRRSRPKPYGAGWSVFEDHTALIRNGPLRRQQTLDELKTLGADTLRVSVKWNEVAPAPTRAKRPRFDATDPGAYPGFGPYDDLLRRARAMGFRVIAGLAPDAPRWATAGGRGYAETANLWPSPAEFRSFAGAVARRYSGGYRDLPEIEWYSIWNEPNHLLFLKPLERTPGIYRAMVKGALPAIRANAAPGANVLIGETAPAGRPGRSIGPREFIERFLAGAGRLEVDGWAHHPYGPADSVPPGRDIVNMLAIRRLGSYLDRAASQGVLPSRLPIYNTEFGLQSNPPDPTVTTTLAEQARQLNEKEELSYRYPRLRSYAQYLLYDDPQRPGPREVAWAGFQTGLRFSNGRDKPSLIAYKLPIVVRKRGGGVSIWGHVRPGKGPRFVQLQRRSGRGFANDGAPIRTNSGGYFAVRRGTRAQYRYQAFSGTPGPATALGFSRTAVPR